MPSRPPPFWQALVLLIVFVCAVVSLFAALVYLLTRGVELSGWPPAAHIAVFVLVSGLFAWLVKRLSDTVSGFSRNWFPEPGPEDESAPRNRQ